MSVYWHILPDPNLTKMAQNIFGSIVDKAYACMGRNGDCTKDELQKKLYKQVTSEINNDAKDIIIQFTNGHSVLFTNSEWGTIEKVSLTKETKIVKE